MIESEPSDPQSDKFNEFVKQAAHASWIAPILALLIEGLLASEASESLVLHFFLALGAVLVVTVLCAAGLGLGIYAVIRSQNIAGVRKPAVFGIFVSGCFLTLSLGGFLRGFVNANAAPRLTNSDVAVEMKQRANEAIEIAGEDFGITLDLSPESVEDVEAILAHIHKQHARTPFEHEQLTEESLQWGGYVGEVIKTVHVCDWALDSSIGAGTLPLAYDDESEVFPVDWCYKRIVHGDDENLWHKFKTLVSGRPSS